MAVGDPFVGNVRNRAPMGYEVIKVASFRNVAINNSTVVEFTAVPFDCEVVAVQACIASDGTGGAGAVNCNVVNNEKDTAVPLTTTKKILTTDLDLKVDGSTTPQVKRSTIVSATNKALTKGQFLQAYVSTANNPANLFVEISIVVQAKAQTDGTVAEAL